MREVLERVETVCGKTVAALSAATAVELAHGIYRARQTPTASAGKPSPSRNYAGLPKRHDHSIVEKGVQPISMGNWGIQTS